VRKEDALKKFVDLLKNRLFISFLGIVLLCVLIYFAGAELGYRNYRPLATALARWLTIVLVVVTWLALVAWRRRRAFMTNALLWTGLAARSNTASEQASKDDLEKIRAKGEEAFALLRKMRVKRSGGAVYARELPWYIMIGAPGVGKTTALLNAGLNFPLAARLGTAEIKGVAGTRNVDWFITDEAVLIDTAGRFLTQDSSREVDSATWMGFLDLLKRQRPQRPINGVLLSISAADLQQLSSADRRAQAEDTRQRLEELHRAFSLRLPVYVLITKCDLLAGFTQFYADMGKEELAQVWGTTFELSADAHESDVLPLLPAELAALEGRLSERMLSRLREERDTSRRALIQAFPQQFSLLCGSLLEYVQDVFAYPISESTRVRGVYFTSGTQEGTPLDRVMNALAKSMGLNASALPAHAEEGKAFFITRLLREVIYKEEDLAGANLRVQRRHALLQRFAYASAILATASVIGYWALSFIRDRTYLSTAEHATAALEEKVRTLPAQPDLHTLLPVLDAARNMPGGVEQRIKSSSHSWGLGLDQSGKLEKASIDIYHRLLHSAWLRFIAHQMESGLQSEGDDLQLYELLKAYLILTGNAPAGKVDKDFARLYADKQAASVSSDMRPSFISHTIELFTTPARDRSATIDNDLVEKTRAKLIDPQPAVRLYRLTKTHALTRPLLQAEYSPTQEDHLAGQVLARKSGLPINKGIPQFFTLKGHAALKAALADIVKSQVDDAWVLNETTAHSPANMANLQAAVSDLYYSEYIRTWRGLLADYTVAPLGDTRQALQRLGLLAGRDSPLRKLTLVAAEQTTLTKPNGKDAKEALAAITTPVDKEFEPLHRLVSAENGKSQLDALLETLNGAHQAMGTVKEKVARGDQVQPEDVQAFAALRDQAPMQPLPIRSVLEAVAAEAGRVSRVGNYAIFDEDWRSQVWSDCRQKIMGRYPFDPDSSQDVQLSDFSRLFGPGGAIDKFVERLDAYIYRDGRILRARASNQFGLSISPGTLAALQQAEEIREAYFSNGQSPSVSFSLTPVSMDPSIRLFTFDWGDVDNKLTFENGKPRIRQSISWPPEKGREVARIEVAPAGPQGGGSTRPGPWALWKLMGSAQVKRVANRNEYSAAFVFDGRRVQLTIQPDAEKNPFSTTSLKYFRCPEHL